MEKRLIDSFPENMSHSSWFRRTFCVPYYCKAENAVLDDVCRREVEAWEAGRNNEPPPNVTPNRLFCKGIG